MLMQETSFDDPFLLHCSQTCPIRYTRSSSLMILFFYTALKPGYIRGYHLERLMILFFYTALKLAQLNSNIIAGLMILFFYTALKQQRTNS